MFRFGRGSDSLCICVNERRRAECVSVLKTSEASLIHRVSSSGCREFVFRRLRLLLLLSAILCLLWCRWLLAVSLRCCPSWRLEAARVLLMSVMLRRTLHSCCFLKVCNSVQTYLMYVYVYRLSCSFYCRHGQCWDKKLWYSKTVFMLIYRYLSCSKATMMRLETF